MKKKYIIIFASIILILLVLLAILHYFAFHPEGIAIFSRTSADYNVILIRGNSTVSIILICLFVIFSIYFIIQKNVYKILKITTLSMILLLWLLNCRTLALILYPDGRISSGWFCLETDRFYVCSEQNRGDCETVIYQRTQIQKYPFWLIRIKNNELDKTIFIGPFLWYKTLKAIDKEFYFKGENQLSN